MKLRAYFPDGSRLTMETDTNEELIAFSNALLRLSIHHNTVVENIPVMRWLWFPDLKWEEIFQWDIVNLKSFEPEIYKVIFERGAFCFLREDDDYPIDCKYLEKSTVIWNIYQNSNLLKDV